MADIISFLSGKVPGGIILFLFILLIVNLVFLFFTSSKLITPQKSKKQRFIFSIGFIAFYIILWISLQPASPKTRLVILPSLNADSALSLNAANFTLTDLAEEQVIKNNLNKKYLFQRWEWLLEALGSDSANHYRAWRNLSVRMGAGLIVESRFTSAGMSCSVRVLKDGKYTMQDFSVPKQGSCRKILATLQKRLTIFKTYAPARVLPAQRLLEARLMIVQGRLNKAETLLKGQTSAEAKILQGIVLAKQGFKEKIDREKAKYVPQRIEEFEQAKRIFAALMREKKDTAELAYWLGRMEMYLQNFNKAEIYLKNALLRDRSNSRIYYQLSFLLPRRLKDFGFKNRKEILERAVYFDPVFRQAVYELGNEYYVSGSGIPSATAELKARATLERYLSIKNDDPQILSLLASIYLKTSQIDKAYRIFQRLQKRFPNDSNSYYDLGVVFFMKKNYPRALEYFKKAIALDQNLDAFLYAGITCQRMGNKKQALHYYRERVKRKTGDDDRYADEAVKGIRSILADSLNGEKHESASHLSKHTAKNQ